MERRNDDPTRDGTTRQTGSFTRRRILQLAGAGLVGTAVTAGSAVAESGSYSHTIDVVADERASYTFTTDGRLKRLFDNGDNSAERFNDTVTENGDGTWTAEGYTGNGKGDGFAFDGAVTDFEVIEGQCTIYVDGEETSIEELLGEEDSNSPSASEDGPVGGGQGYDNLVGRGDADTVVSSKTDLESALSDASSGDVVYLAGDASIDMGTTDVVVPSGVTLASNRGIDDAPGGHLYTDEETKSIYLNS
ncbi:MAG: hypothetical protein ACOCPT_05185, partial [Halanaeroarchaeum sp.]